MNWRILHGDVREKLAELPAGSVQTCVTSPPYFGLRDYGHADQIGSEESIDDYVAALVAVFQAVSRLLCPDGTAWINLGDSYAGSWGAQSRQGASGQMADRSIVSARQIANAQKKASRTGSVERFGGSIKAKDLIGIPWRVAFALQADGWYLRSDIVWNKPNPMPESVTDRPTKSHEYLFLLSKSARYYYDADAIAEPLPESSIRRYSHAVNTNEQFSPERHKHTEGVQSPMELLTRAAAGVLERGTRNKRSVWTVATQPYPEAHFATYPEKLIEPCILAGSRPGDTVLDPFTGSGTTGAVAIRHQRNFVGCELNADYLTLARKRIAAVAPLLAIEASA